MKRIERRNQPWSTAELQRAVRIERMELQQERIKIVKRLAQIEARLSELDKAENLLDGE